MEMNWQRVVNINLREIVMSIRIRNLDKSFNGFQALKDINLDIEDGELIALLGPSGSGKTTLLRLIAGLEFADRGQIFFGDRDTASLPVRERQVGFVFQHYALFKHMTVAENVAFGLRVRERSRRPSDADIRRRAQELLELVRLSELGKRYPSQLSGGQRQRVALARALAIDPQVLLLDEPFGALDARVRKDLRDWLRELHDRTGYTTVFVTHDQEEALELADRVVVLNGGRIEQVGTTNEVYERPASPFVFDFLGSVNQLEVEVRNGFAYLRGGDIPLAQVEADYADGAYDLYVRPADLRVGSPDAPGLDVRVKSTQRTGPLVRVAVETPSHALLTVELPHLHHDVEHLKPGAEVRLRIMQLSLYSPPAIALAS